MRKKLFSVVIIWTKLDLRVTVKKHFAMSSYHEIYERHPFTFKKDWPLISDYLRPQITGFKATIASHSKSRDFKSNSSMHLCHYTSQTLHFKLKLKRFKVLISLSWHMSCQQNLQICLSYIFFLYNNNNNNKYTAFTPLFHTLWSIDHNCSKRFRH